MFKIFDKLGGEKTVIQLLNADTGEGISDHAFRKWRVRRSLPGGVVKRLMRICDERGVSYCHADFVPREETVQ